MKLPRFTTLQLLLATAGIALVVGLYAAAWRNEKRAVVTNVTFSPDGQWLAVRFQSDLVQFWDVTGNPRLVRQADFSDLGHFSYEPLAFLNDRSIVLRQVTFIGNPNVLLYDPIADTRRILREHGTIWPLKVALSAEVIAMADYGTNVTLVPIRNPDEETIVKLAAGEVLAAISPDGRTLATVSRSGTQLIDVATQVATRLSTEPARQGEFSPDGRQFFAVHNQSVQAFDVATGAELWTSKRELGSMIRVVNANRVVTDEFDGWNVLQLPEQTLLRKFERRPQTSLGLGDVFWHLDGYRPFGSECDLSPDGKTFAYVPDERELRLADVDSGRTRSIYFRGPRWPQVLVFIVGFLAWAVAWNKAAKPGTVARVASPKRLDRKRVGVRVGGVALVLMLVLWLLNIFRIAEVADAFTLAKWGIAGVVALVAFLRWAEQGQGKFLGFSEFVVRVARRASGTQGRRHEAGGVTVWVTGTSTIETLADASVRVIAVRLQELFGGSFTPTKPTTILGFDRVAVYRVFLGEDDPPCTGCWSDQRGLCFAVCEPICQAQLVRPIRFLRGTLASALLQVRPFLPPWLQLLAVSWTAADDERPRILAATTLRLRAAVAAGSRDEWLRRLTATQIDFLRLSQATDLASHQECRRWADLSRSLSEYFLERASSVERENFLRFCRELHAVEDQADAFQRQMGYSLADLIDRWQAWLLASPEPVVPPPDAEQQRMLTEVALPVLLDPQARRADRIQVVRAIGDEHFSVPTAIRVLTRLRDDPTCSFQEEIAAALAKLGNQLVPCDETAPNVVISRDDSEGGVASLRVAFRVAIAAGIWAVSLSVLSLFQTTPNFFNGTVYLAVGMFALRCGLRQSADSLRRLAWTLLGCLLCCDPLLASTGWLLNVLRRDATVLRRSVS